MSTTPAGWTRVSEYAITRPGQSIARTGAGADLQYALYGSGPAMLGHWPTAKEAMEAADRVRAGGDSIFECMACYPKLCHCQGRVSS